MMATYQSIGSAQELRLTSLRCVRSYWHTCLIPHPSKPTLQYVDYTLFVSIHSFSSKHYFVETIGLSAIVDNKSTDIGRNVSVVEDWKRSTITPLQQDKVHLLHHTGVCGQIRNHRYAFGPFLDVKCLLKRKIMTLQQNQAHALVCNIE